MNMTHENKTDRKPAQIHRKPSQGLPAISENLKEAVMKALGTGWGDGVRWVDIETTREPGQAPKIELHGRTKELAAERGISRWHLTITHDVGLALAFVVAESED